MLATKNIIFLYLISVLFHSFVEYIFIGLEKVIITLRLNFFKWEEGRKESEQKRYSCIESISVTF